MRKTFPMKEPFFSIITVVYNAEKVAGATAASLQNQNFRDFEWIVVDGGSSDATLEVIRPFLIEGRDTVISEPDQGVYDAMNKGLRQARGKVVQFLNAGDRLADENVLDHVAAEFSDNVDAVYGDTILELADGLTMFTSALDLNVNLHRGMPISHQSLFTRREIHLRHPFDLTYRISADYAAIAAMQRAGARTKHLHETLNVNSIEPEAISVAGKARSAAEDFRIHREILGRSSIEASFYYLRKRAIVFAVGLLKCLPLSLYDRLPEAIRRRVY